MVSITLCKEMELNKLLSGMNIPTNNQQLTELGISSEMIAERKLQQFEETDSLQIAEIGEDGREHFLVGEATDAWRCLKKAADSDGEEIFIVSAFRSISRQVEIIRGKIEEGLSIEDIIKVCAPPGYSEHHTGRALDISTHGVESLSEEFKNSTAFEWLNCNAQRFFFTLSYPRNNSAGYLYEPWHWRYDAT